MSTITLEVTKLHAWRGEQHVLKGINLTAKRGELICLNHDNEYHRREVLHSLMGIKSKRHGSIRVHNTEALNLGMQALHGLGMSYCSKRTNIEQNLSCEENLLLPPPNHSLGGGIPLNELYDLMPPLHQNKNLPALHLESGVQQLLSMAKALRHGADLLIIRDLLLDAAPSVKHYALQLIKELKARDYTIILSSHCIHPFKGIADHIYHWTDGQLHPAALGA